MQAIEQLKSLLGGDQTSFRLPLGEPSCELLIEAEDLPDSELLRRTEALLRRLPDLIAAAKASAAGELLAEVRPAVTANEFMARIRIDYIDWWAEAGSYLCAFKDDGMLSGQGCLVEGELDAPEAV